MNKWKKVMTGQSGTGPMTGQLTGPMTGQMTGPSKSRYYTQTKGPEGEDEQVKKVMTGQSGTGPMTGQMTGPSKIRYYTQ